MGRKRLLLYDILGTDEGLLRPGGKRPQPQRKRPRRGRRKPSSAVPGRLRLPLSLALLALVLVGGAYYIGSRGSGAESTPPGLLLKTSGSPTEEEIEPVEEAPPRAHRDYWTVQVITYPDTRKGRARAEDLMDRLADAGFPDVHGLEAEARKMIAVAVGRLQSRAMLEGLRDEIRALKMGGRKPFKSAYIRHVRLPE